MHFNSLNAELNPICHLLTLLGAHHILHVCRVRVKDRTLIKVALWISTELSGVVLYNILFIPGNFQRWVRKVKLLKWATSHESKWGSVDIAAHVLSLGTRAVSFRVSGKSFFYTWYALVGEISYGIRGWFMESYIVFTICLFIYLYLRCKIYSYPVKPTKVIL